MTATKKNLRPSAKSADKNRTQFNRVMQLVSSCIPDEITMHGKMSDNDERLIRLVQLVAPIADNSLLVEYGSESQRFGAQIGIHALLQTLAAFSMEWVFLGGGADRIAVAELVWQERERQRALLKAGKFTLDVAHPTPDARRKVRVLIEEIGEVAEAIDKIENASVLDLKARFAHLRTELVQVCAVCFAWLESMEVKP